MSRFLALLGLGLVVAGCGGGGGGGGGVVPIGKGTTVQGYVMLDGYSAGIPGVTVRFFGPTGTLIAQATTDATGKYSTKINPSATSFHLLRSSINDAIYYPTYYCNGLIYQPSNLACVAPLPTLPQDGTVTLPSISIPSKASPPPPPPTGCPFGS